MTNFKPETLLLHGGQEPDPVTGSRTVPVYRSTAFVFKDTAHAQRLFALEEAGNIYTKLLIQQLMCLKNVWLYWKVEQRQ